MAPITQLSRARSAYIRVLGVLSNHPRKGTCGERVTIRLGFAARGH